MSYPSALEIAQVSPGQYMNSELLMGVLADTPALAHFAKRELVGRKFLSMGIVALPTAHFLNLGEGYQYGHTDTALMEFNASRIGDAIKLRVSTEKAWNEANRSAIGAGLAMDAMGIQAMGTNKAQMLHVERQVFDGVSNDAKGFPGMKALTPYVAANVLAMTDTAQDSDFEKGVLNVGGSTATTASSIYAVKYGSMDCELLIGGDKGVAGFLDLDVPEKVWMEYTDAVDGLTKMDWFHVTKNEGYIGLSIGGGNEANATRRLPNRSVRRAANVTMQDGYTCNDALLATLRNTFHDGKPDALFMSFRSIQQLQKSRSPASTIYVGGVLPGNSAFNYAPMPTEHEGIPIIATRAIGNTNAIES